MCKKIILVFILVTVLFTQDNLDTEKAKALIKQWKTGNSNVKKKVVVELQKIKKKATSCLLSSIRENESSFWDELEILGEMRYKKATEPLMTTFKGYFFDSRVIDAIKDIKGNHIAILREGLKSNIIYTKKVCINVLGYYGHRALSDATFDFDISNKEFFENLDELPLSIILSLEKMLDDEDHLVREEARRAIRKIGIDGFCADTKYYFAHKLAKILRKKDHPARKNVAFLLAVLNGWESPVVKIMSEFAQDEDLEVRMQIMRGLRNLNAVQELKIACGDKNEKIRVYALRSLKEIKERKLQALKRK
ncbi:HEAT repeat domain-containing protein [Candidatus Uabimicrobium sp. HlEnr_7]|uniref:HEAT repeat domain-containing protein n=1 Tax=Candidatus Uabimicrobium helgolandensis TaxID=3095367 RepID=UPI003559120F